jgi:hypothetical protein
MVIKMIKELGKYHYNSVEIERVLFSRYYGSGVVLWTITPLLRFDLEPASVLNLSNMYPLEWQYL